MPIRQVKESNLGTAMGVRLSAIAQPFKNYKVITEIGEGGLGQVYKAIDLRSGRVVAIKVLHNRFQTNTRFLGIFHKELLIVSRLKHKHIVESIDSSFRPPLCYIVSEFIDGWSLHALMKKINIFPPLIALSIAIDILQGIDYLHLHDTIHADLSSANVMIEKTGRVLVTDFGLACQDAVEDHRNYMVGTPGFYSPEHVGDTAIVPQSDLYCVALLIYQMMTGTKAVPASKNRKEILSFMKKINFSRISCSDIKLQFLMRRFLKKALKQKSSRRFTTAEEMLIAIYKILRSYDIRYTRYAIHQFLSDQKLTQRNPRRPSQNIYQGALAKPKA
ncbi:MAG: serine/threonine protein kinase [Oligoflexales bacterium]